MFYFNGYSAFVVILAVAAAVLLWQVVRGGAQWLLNLNRMGPPPNASIFDARVDSKVPLKRGGWLPYWAAFGLLLGAVVRSFTANDFLLALGMVGVAFAAWKWLTPVYQRGGGKMEGNAPYIFIAMVAVGYFAGWIARGTGWWAAVLAVIAAACAALMIRRPEGSGFLSKP